MKYIKIYINGVCVLAGALAINMLSKIFGFMNWYEFIDHPSNATIIDYSWLFIGYPFCLGLVVLVIFKVSKKFK